MLYKLIEEMSNYERLPLGMTETRLLRDGFGKTELFQALSAFVDDQPAGYALMHSCYASFEGRGLFLEDLYIREPFRGQDLGKRLVSAVAQVAREQECFGIVLNILLWNSPALRFFKSIGAIELDDRAVFVIPSDHLGTL